MSKLRVNAFTVSGRDGSGAGPDQGRDYPLGRGGEELHQWSLPTRKRSSAREYNGKTAGRAPASTTTSRGSRRVLRFHTSAQIVNRVQRGEGRTQIGRNEKGRAFSAR